MGRTTQCRPPLYQPADCAWDTYANDVKTCGTILGSVNPGNGSYHPVVWTKPLCDSRPHDVLEPAGAFDGRRTVGEYGSPTCARDLATLSGAS
jgi:hypothetical protein